MFVDKAGDNAAILATYEGRTVTILDYGKSVIGDNESPERKRWIEFEEKARAKTNANVSEGIKARL